MSVKKYIKKNYEGSEAENLLAFYKKHEGILSGNFYHWENEFKDSDYDEQLAVGFVPFLEDKVKRVIENAGKLQKEEIEKEQASEAEKEEAWQDGSQQED
ncbi:hypothetical protein G7081_01375 [Vagococcus coleopterorum]|uniref:Uncharacterized protein n=1 Tax=Vagococcus coleopterorum TaxID=2714946 RepID=A0A6G8ALN3_9ENTE|nr:hypothetical protein [Vagococcus coleopterorum]QIL45833.1 hypothetical protein G7081_01375 [Vagococcus coleopterorum]